MANSTATPAPAAATPAPAAVSPGNAAPAAVHHLNLLCRIVGVLTDELGKIGIDAQKELQAIWNKIDAKTPPPKSNPPMAASTASQAAAASPAPAAASGTPAPASGSSAT